MNTEVKRTIKIEREIQTVVEEIQSKGISDAAHKQWMTKLKNIISELSAELDNSISYSVHQQWMTKKDKEIQKLTDENEKLKAKLKQK